jgi:two-component system, chemotaxis family, CheB/CheR fusion protein
MTASPEAAELAGVSVLVIESNADVRDLLLVLLACAGAVASGVVSGREALGRLGAEVIAPDVILCELSMRGVDGFAFLEQLKQRPALRQVPVIAMTGEPIAGKLRALNAGFDGHVPKPFAVSTIHNEIRRILRHR